MAEEAKIPVFAVLKNGTILKNIFLNNPQWLSAQTNGPDDSSPVLIGRHPDCHVALDHPSISRFHLGIRADPASLKLSVTDLSSVHGTWVSGNRIEPNIPTELTEGGIVKLGESTRLYHLHWVPLSSAFEMENPLPTVLEENEACAEEISSLPLETEQPSTRSLVSEPVVMEGQNMTPEKNLNDNDVQIELRVESGSLPLETEHPSPHSLVPEPVCMEREYTTPEKNLNDNDAQTEMRVESGSGILSRRSKSKSVSFLSVQTGRSKLKNGEEIEKGGEESICRALFSKEENEEETHVSDKENMTPLSSKSLILKRDNVMTNSLK